MFYGASLQLYVEGNPPGSSLTSSSARLAANKIQAHAVAAGPGGKKHYFAREWEGKEGAGRGFWFWTSAAISCLSNQPRSCQHCPPAAQATLFSLEPLEAPSCARNKTPCSLHGPSTSLHSSDNNSLPVLLTSASFPCSFQSFLCTKLRSLAILLWHRIPLHPIPGLSAGHRASRQTSPRLSVHQGGDTRE